MHLYCPSLLITSFLFIILIASLLFITFDCIFIIHHFWLLPYCPSLLTAALLFTFDCIFIAQYFWLHLYCSSLLIGSLLYITFEGDISTLEGTPLKLVDKFTYLGSSVESTEKDIETRLTKAWTAINRLSTIWKSDLTDKMKRSFFQAAVTSILLYGCTTWTLTKQLEKKLDGNYTRMLRAILNKSWQQHPTRHQLYGHLPPITKTIQVRRTRHAGHCWRSRDELIRDVLLWIPTHGRTKAGRPARTYIQQLCEDTGCCPEDLPRAMNDREEWRERVRDIRAASTIWWWWWWWFLITSLLSITFNYIPIVYHFWLHSSCFSLLTATLLSNSFYWTPFVHCFWLHSYCPSLLMASLLSIIFNCIHVVHHYWLPPYSPFLLTEFLLSIIIDCIPIVSLCLSYLPTPPLGQDMTQGQFISGF